MRKKKSPDLDGAATPDVETEAKKNPGAGTPGQNDQTPSEEKTMRTFYKATDPDGDIFAGTAEQITGDPYARFVREDNHWRAVRPNKWQADATDILEPYNDIVVLHGPFHAVLVRHGVTVADIATALGVDIATATEIIRADRQITVGQLHELAKHIGSTAADLAHEYDELRWWGEAK